MCVDVCCNVDVFIDVVCEIFVIEGVDVFVRLIVECVGVGVGILYWWFLQCLDFVVVVFCYVVDVIVVVVDEFVVVYVLDEVFVQWLQCFMQFIVMKCGFVVVLYFGDLVFEVLLFYFIVEFGGVFECFFDVVVEVGMICFDVDVMQFLYVVVNFCYFVGLEEQSQILVGLLVDGFCYCVVVGIVF